MAERGDRGISTTGDVDHSIIQVGNDNIVIAQTHVANYHLFPARRSRTTIRPPLGVGDDYEERKLWRRDVEAFLDTPGGYLVVEGPAGAGKSTFLRALAADLNAPAGFAGTDATATRALMELVDRCVDRWSLPRGLADDVERALDGPPFHCSVSDAVHALLAAASARTRGAVVVVLDGFTADGRPLSDLLPHRLPTGVHAVIGQREGCDLGALENVGVLKTRERQSPGELHQWLDKAVRRKPVAEILRVERVAAEDLVEVLAEKAGDVWIYAHYVLHSIAARTLAPADVERLPDDLWRYYKVYFSKWAKSWPETWESRDLPALAVIATSVMELTVEQVSDVLSRSDGWAPDAEGIHSLFARSWIAFLSSPRRRVFGCHHPSLRDFLSGSSPAGDLTADERALRDQLANAVVQAHRDLTHYFLKALAGDAPDRPGLRASASYHATAAGALGDLDHLLIRQEEPIESFGSRRTPRNGAFADADADGDLSGYLRIAQAATDTAHTTRRKHPGQSADVLRYALIAASMTSIAANLPPTVLLAAVVRGVWTAEEVVRQIAATPDARDRETRLVAVSQYLNGPALLDAADLLVRTGSSKGVVAFLSALAPAQRRLPRETLAALLDVVTSEDLTAVCRCLLEEPSADILMLVRRALTHDYWTDDLADVVRACGETAPPDRLEAMVREIQKAPVDEPRKAHALAELVPLLPQAAERVDAARWVEEHIEPRRLSYLSRHMYSVDDARALGRIMDVLADESTNHAERFENVPAPRRPRTASALRRWFHHLRNDRVSSPPARPPLPDDPEWVAHHRCAAASAARSDAVRREHAQLALQAIMRVSNYYARGQLLIELARSAGGELDTSACLKALPDLHREIQGPVVEELLPWMSGDERQKLFRWATRGRRPLDSVIRALGPRLSLSFNPRCPVSCTDVV